MKVVSTYIVPPHKSQRTLKSLFFSDFFLEIFIGKVTIFSTAWLQLRYFVFCRICDIVRRYLYHGGFGSVFTLNCFTAIHLSGARQFKILLQDCYVDVAMATDIGL